MLVRMERGGAEGKGVGYGRFMLFAVCRWECIVAGIYVFPFLVPFRRGIGGCELPTV